MESKKKKLTGQQGELMRALDITMDDLNANDDGYITDEQMASVIKRQSAQWQGYLGLAGFLTVFGTGFLGIAYMKPDKLLPLFIMSLIFWGIALIMGLGSMLYRQRIKSELAKGSVETTQGIAVVNVLLEASHLEINGMKLMAPPDVLRRVQHLQPYIVHFLPDSKIILSMEHIAEDSNIRQSEARLRDHDVDKDTTHDYMSDESQNVDMQST